MNDGHLNIASIDGAASCHVIFVGFSQRLSYEGFPGYGGFRSHTGFLIRIIRMHVSLSEFDLDGGASMKLSTVFSKTNPYIPISTPE